MTNNTSANEDFLKAVLHGTPAASEITRAKKIARLNDKFRQTCERWGFPTFGALELSEADHGAMAERVRRFKAFEPRREDPLGTHDIGTFDYNGEKFFWQISYYADDILELPSDDPADPAKTHRVMTISYTRHALD